MRSVPAIGFDVHPSRLLAASVVVVAMLAIVAVWLSGMPWWLCVATTGGVVAHASLTMLRLRQPVLAALLWHGDGSWTLRLADGRETEATLRSARVLGPLIALRLAWLPGGSAALVLLPDNLDADTRRRLRMRLSAAADTD
jgi:toxin CptA